MNNKLFDFIEKSPTAFHAVYNTKETLLSEGFVELSEGKTWDLEWGMSYFVTRNNSSLIAFRLPTNEAKGFMIGASHSDSPCFKLKDNALIIDKDYVRFSAEKYGGMINSTWMDRPLSLAGRVVVVTDKGIESRLVDFKDPVAIIPSVAIHLCRNANENTTLNAAVDLVPLYSASQSEPSFESMLAKFADASAEDILSSDLFLYNADKGVCWNNLISAPRLDDLQCVFSSLHGFLSASPEDSIPVLAVFDNEEVGSSTKQGADSDFLYSVLSRISRYNCGDFSNLNNMLANSLMLSCDNGHAVHPNHPELTDKNNEVKLNGGIVLKFNANQKYCTDAVSASLVKLLCKRAEVPCQEYSNRSDIAGGSTLGNIANTHLSVITADVGLPQLAMHSALETAGADDTEYMIKLMKEFFSSTLNIVNDGEYQLNRNN